MTISMLQGAGASQGGASTPALSKSYAFDAMGNRTGLSDAVAHTQVTSAYNNLNQLTGQNSFSTASGASVATGSSSFGYDGDGNMSLVSSKDATETVTSQTSYSYDDASRLIGITTPGSSKWQFVYDGMSRLRISRSWVWQNGAWVQNSEVYRVYLGMEVVQERDSNNNVTASYSGGLTARSTATGTVFYGFDGNGSVTSLTDSTGAVVGSYTYDAWGNIVSSSGPKAQENPYRYSGKEQLAGYYSYGFRFYSSGLGRWINPDPLGEDGGNNLYGFVQNNPMNLSDEYGLQGWAGAAAAAAAGIATYYYGKDYKGSHPFTPTELRKIRQLHGMMKNGGIGFLIPYLQYGGVKDLSDDDPTTTAFTRKGIGNIGNVTFLDDDFFTDNHGNDRLATLIHEGLHSYCGAYKSAQGSSEDPKTPHGRVSLWANKFAWDIRSKGSTTVPDNIADVIRNGAKPTYSPAWLHKLDDDIHKAASSTLF